MKPYLAVILESFRAAAHSRSLWVTLVLISLFLASIYPLSLDEVQSQQSGTGPTRLCNLWPGPALVSRTDSLAAALRLCSARRERPVAPIGRPYEDGRG